MEYKDYELHLRWKLMNRRAFGLLHGMQEAKDEGKMDEFLESFKKLVFDGMQLSLESGLPPELIQEMFKSEFNKHKESESEEITELRKELSEIVDAAIDSFNLNINGKI